MFLVILLMMALLVIALMVEAPAIATQIKREREEEMMHRGQQYARAIKRYFKKTGRYPSRIEDLENTNGIRFLRQRYTDPITGKDDWRLIHLGEAKIVPKSFTQGGVTGGIPGGVPGGVPGGLTGGIPLGSQMGVPGATSGARPTGVAPVNPIGAFQQGAGTPLGATPGSPLGTPATAFGSGPVLGGGAIIGVSSSSEKESLKEMDGKNHYKDWEFVYDPRFDPGAAMGQQGVRPGVTGQPGQALGQPLGQPGQGGIPVPTTPPPPTKP